MAVWHGRFTELLITGVIDGPLSGGIPKAIELYACSDILDLSEFCLESPNNGVTTPSTCDEFSFPSVQVPAGTFLYVSTTTTDFENFFGLAELPEFFFGDSVASINGDDAIVLYRDDVIVDFFGEDEVDGSGRQWEYTDGWAYRNDDTSPSSKFNLGDWTFSGPNALDGESTNDDSTPPFPLGTFSSTACQLCSATCSQFEGLEATVMQLSTSSTRAHSLLKAEMDNLGASSAAADRRLNAEIDTVGTSSAAADLRLNALMEAADNRLNAKIDTVVTSSMEADRRLNSLMEAADNSLKAEINMCREAHDLLKAEMVAMEETVTQLRATVEDLVEERDDTDPRRSTSRTTGKNSKSKKRRMTRDRYSRASEY